MFKAFQHGLMKLVKMFFLELSARSAIGIGMVQHAIILMHLADISNSTTIEIRSHDNITTSAAKVIKLILASGSFELLTCWKRMM